MRVNEFTRSADWGYWQPRIGTWVWSVPHKLATKQGQCMSAWVTCVSYRLYTMMRKFIRSVWHDVVTTVAIHSRNRANQATVGICTVCDCKWPRLCHNFAIWTFLYYASSFMFSNNLLIPSSTTNLEIIEEISFFDYFYIVKMIFILNSWVSFIDA